MVYSIQMYDHRKILGQTLIVNQHGQEGNYTLRHRHVCVRLLNAIYIFRTFDQAEQTVIIGLTKNFGILIKIDFVLRGY